MPNLEIENIPFPIVDWSVAPDPQEIEQLCELAALPMWEKMGWLEEAQRYVEHMKAQREARASKI